MIARFGALTPTNAFIAANAVALAWDLVIAGRIVNNRRGSPFFLALTALVALLAVPAVVVAVTSVTILNGKAVHIIEWLWPMVLGVCTLQATHALIRGGVSPFLGLPLVAFNAILFASGLARFASTLLVDPPAPLMAFSAAHASVFALLFGREALTSPLIIQVPILAPSFPAVYRLGKTLRASLAVWASASAILCVAKYPSAIRAAQTFAAFSDDRLRERPRGDLAIGVRLFPDLTGPPPSIAVREDLAVVDSLDAGAVGVVIRPHGGTTSAALDSLARVVEPLRRRGAQLVVSLGYSDSDGEQFRRNPEAYQRARLEILDRLVRRLQPDVVFPAQDANDLGVRALGDVPARWWRGYLRESSQVARRANADTRVGVSISTFMAPDSELFAWAVSPGTPIDAIGLSIRPSYGGGSSLEARFRTAERWLRQSTKPAWLFASGAYPRLYGEANQQRALWGALAWATNQPRVTGFLVDGAGDYDALTGLRAPGGRLRPAFDMLVTTKQRLAETRTVGR